MKSVIIDTNALLRFLLNDIPSQKIESEKVITQAKNNKIKLFIAQATIFELDFILRKYYEFEKKVVIEQLKPLIATEYLLVESQDIFEDAIFIYQKENISFVDCFLLAKANLENAKLFTFDKKLQKLGE